MNVNSAKTLDKNLFHNKFAVTLKMIDLKNWSNKYQNIRIIFS